MIDFAPPPHPAFDASCALEPAYRLLDYYTNHRTDVTVDGVRHENVVLFEFLKTLKNHPDYAEARRRFLDSARHDLEQAGGKVGWLEGEL